MLSKLLLKALGGVRGINQSDRKVIDYVIDQTMGYDMNPTNPTGEKRRMCYTSAAAIHEWTVGSVDKRNITRSVDKLLEIRPQRIVYVSCNSATQARDLGLLQHDYTIAVSQAVDMFPQTHHVENIILLEKKHI